MAVDSTNTKSTAGPSAWAWVAELRASVAAVFRNPRLRRMQMALAGSMIGDWAYSVAVAVWAYQVGGPGAVGVWGAIKYVLMAFAAPLGSVLGDRLPRKQVLIGSDLLRAVLVVAATLCLYAGTPPWPIFVLATLVSLVSTVFRPTQMAWMPSLTDQPEELTAANGTASTIESLAFFIGPAIGAALIAATDIETVFLLNAATFLFSAFMVLPIHPLPAPPREDEDPPEDASGAGPGVLAEMAAGFTTIRRHRDLLMISVLTTSQTLVAGAMLVFAIVFAVDLLETGPEGVGYIDSVFGIGAIVGGFFVLARASRNRLASDLALGTALWCLPLLLVVLWPSPVTVFAAAVAMGFGNPLVDASFVTLVQRIAPQQVLGRVFGAYEAMLIASMALGSALMPLLIDRLGLRTALAIIAGVVAVPALSLMARCRALDATLAEPAGTSVLRAIPMFSPLSRARLEDLATRLTRESAPAGTIVLRQGEESDRFLVIVSGRVDVTADGRLLRTEGPGEYFGEIGLLRDVPRTATVTATEDTELLCLSRDDFLEAVSGEESRSEADAIVARRLG